METDIIIVLICIIANVIPAFSPVSTFVVLSYFDNTSTYNYNIWYLIFLGVLGSSIGRVLLAKGMYRFSLAIENKRFHKNMVFFEKLVSGKSFYPFTFALIYSLFPSPTNWLFIPSGKNNWILAQITLGHAIGRVVNYYYTLLFISTVFSSIFKNPLDPFSILVTIIFSSFILMDWESLFIDRKFKWIFEPDEPNIV